MKNKNRFLLLFTIAISFVAQASFDTDVWLKQNLIQKQTFLRTASTIDDLLKMEQEELAKLTQKENLNPSDAITPKQAQRLLDSISPHPVVGQEAYDFYNRPGREIGFCFGRATYVHLALLKMGVKKEAIKKIWTVGETGGQMNWIYHVATAVRTTDGKWTVIDNFVGKLVTAQEWATEMRKMTVDGKKATFITDAKKFHPQTGTYSRVELGLDLSREKDYYQHYFRDLFAWFSSSEAHEWFSKYGLRRVNGEKIKVPARLQPQVAQTTAVGRFASAVCRPLQFADIFRRQL